MKPSSRIIIVAAIVMAMGISGCGRLEVFDDQDLYTQGEGYPTPLYPVIGGELNTDNEQTNNQFDPDNNQPQQTTDQFEPTVPPILGAEGIVIGQNGVITESNTGLNSGLNSESNNGFNNGLSSDQSNTALNDASGNAQADTPQARGFLINEPTDKTPVTRQTMVGAWTVSALDTNCQIFLALTKWSGGFRAASRGCVPQVLADFQAWDVQNDTVTMINSSGAQTAILYRTGPERFDGVTIDGAPISFSR